MMRSSLTLIALVLAGNVGAATLKADALVCEDASPFAVIAAEGWTSKGGAAQMNTARMSAQAAKLSGQFAAAQRGLATAEESIRADSSRRLASGSTTSRALAAEADSKSAGSALSTYERIATTCAASGPAPLAAEVVEDKPISGLAKVRIDFNGATASLWTRRQDLAD